MFEGYAPSFQELKLVVQNAPGVAHALIKAHQAYRRVSEQLASIDRELTRGMPETTPYEEVRDFFHFVDNYVHDLDVAAERLASELRQADDRQGGLKRRLETGHGVRISYDLEGDALRTFHAANMMLHLNKYSPLHTQQFQMAIQLAQLEAANAIDEIVGSAGFRSAEAAEVCKIGLQNYYAGALLMPYREFLEAARLHRHDVHLLSLRFNTSLEQVCHRLSTLQRPGQKGIPIFFAKIDRAGNITKRHSATKLQFARFGAACPLWNAHQAFESQGRIIRQLAETPDGGRFLSIALQVNKRSGGYTSHDTTYALALGCEIGDASAFIYADDLVGLSQPRYDQIGVSCRICERVKCPSRAAPPVKRKIGIDHHQRMALPYDIN